MVPPGSFTSLISIESNLDSRLRVMRKESRERKPIEKKNDQSDEVQLGRYLHEQKNRKKKEETRKN